MSAPFNRKAARARCMAATDGPWTARRDADYPRQEWREVFAGRVTVVGSGVFDRTVRGETETHAGVRITEANAGFIRAAREDLPAALDLLDRCEAMLKTYAGSEDDCNFCGRSLVESRTHAPDCWLATLIRDLEGE